MATLQANLPSEAILLGEQALAKCDSRMGQLIAKNGHLIREPRTNYFYSLARSIMGQQVSVAAAAAIFGRLEAATDIQPERVATLSVDELRALGVSRQKAGYLHDLAEHFVRDVQVFDHLDSLSDEDVIKELVSVKGIGVWTAQMFLMFTLTRLDVFAPDDVGLQNGMKLLYGWSDVPKRAELERAAEIWRPYRTIASWHLWHSLDNEPKVTA